MATANSNRLTIDRSNEALSAENDHLRQLNETLRNMTKQYTTKYKERELELTRQFKKKEDKYISQIEQLEQDIKFYTSQMNKMTQEILHIRRRETQTSSNQTNQHHKQLQTLNGELFNKDVIIQQLKQELDDENRICEGLREKLASNESEIEILREKLQSMHIMPTTNLTHPISSTMLVPAVNDKYTSSLETPRKRGSSQFTNNTMLGYNTSDQNNKPIFVDINQSLKSDRTSMKTDRSSIKTIKRKSDTLTGLLGIHFQPRTVLSVNVDSPKSIQSSQTASPIRPRDIDMTPSTHLKHAEVFF